MKELLKFDLYNIKETTSIRADKVFRAFANAADVETIRKVLARPRSLKEHPRATRESLVIIPVRGDARASAGTANLAIN